MTGYGYTFDNNVWTMEHCYEAQGKGRQGMVTKRSLKATETRVTLISHLRVTLGHLKDGEGHFGVTIGSL